ncbi:hypothetical protein AYI70_g21 [Smittium culicis]|uniref:Uncharacterized protein n=1 Tax=Smittium culicis TaxID=133412 RepID=A0A1R1YI92_9FUNG|nr:hypothetical protein AYI70_g21 [Smittium culicis]
MKDERPVFSQDVEQSYFNVFSSFEELLGIDTSLILGTTQSPNSKKDINIESEMLNRTMCSAEQSLYKNESVIGNYLNNEYEALRIGRDTLSSEKYLEFGRFNAPELLKSPFAPISGNIYGDYHNIECASNKSTNRHYNESFIPQTQENVDLTNDFDPFLNSSLFGDPNFDSEIFQSQNASKSDNLNFSINSNDFSNNLNALNPGLITSFVSESEKYDFSQFTLGYNLNASREVFEKYIGNTVQNNYNEPIFQNSKDKSSATTQTFPYGTNLSLKRGSDVIGSSFTEYRRSSFDIQKPIFRNNSLDSHNLQLVSDNIYNQSMSFESFDNNFFLNSIHPEFDFNPKNCSKITNLESNANTSKPSSFESRTIGIDSDSTNLASTICNQDSDSKKSSKKKLQFVYVQKEAANEAAKYNADKTMLYIHYNKSEESNDKKNLKSRITNIPSKMP